MRTLLVVFVSVRILALASPAADRPNILFLLSDDQDWTGLGFPQHPDHPGSGNSLFQTPHLEGLAGEGMIFTDAYAPASVCSATRFSLQTGMTTARTGWTKAAPVYTAAQNPPLLPPASLRTFDPDAFTTIGEVLQGAGYLTAHYGKWHINGGGPEANGYHDSDGMNGNEVAFREEMKGDPNPVDIVGMGVRAAAFMARAKEKGRPFFIQMSYHALHAPEHARESTIEKYADSGVKNPHIAAITEDLDTGVGQLLADLDALGLAGNTYVIYMSDNGGGGGGGGGKRGRENSRPIRGGKGSVLEGGVRSPLIIRGPGVPAGAVSRTRVTGLDLFPTFCAWAGVGEAEVPGGIDGGDISHVFRGSEGPVVRPREEIVFHFPHYQGDRPMSTLYLGDHKLVKYYEDEVLHLYDLRTDLGEANDLAPAQPERTAELHNLLVAYLAEVGAQLPRINPDHDPTQPLEMMRGGHGSKDSKGPPREPRGGSRPPR